MIADSMYMGGLGVKLNADHTHAELKVDQFFGSGIIITKVLVLF